jgi:hypothetical protein
MPTPEFFTMQPNEKQPISIDYSVSGSLPASATVSSGTVAAYDMADNANVNSILSSTTTTTTTTSTKIFVTAPSTSNGKRYKITFTTTISDGSILIEDIEMRVIDL